MSDQPPQNAADLGVVNNPDIPVFSPLRQPENEWPPADFDLEEFLERYVIR